MLRVFRRLALALIAATTLVSCDVNPFDQSQVPVVVATTVGATPLVISWQPVGAQLVRVYRGATAGDGYTPSLVWSVVATARNTLTSPLPYGTPQPAGGSTDLAARLLVPGEVYTVQVTRQDPRGTGDGFLNTANRYVGTATFTAMATGAPGR